MRTTASTKAWASSGGVIWPVASRRPAVPTTPCTSVVTTGRAAAIASRITLGMPSAAEVSTSRSAAANSRGTSGRQPMKWTRSATPSRAACRRSLCSKRPAADDHEVVVRQLAGNGGHAVEEPVGPLLRVEPADEQDACGGRAEGPVRPDRIGATLGESGHVDAVGNDDQLSRAAAA